MTGAAPAAGGGAVHVLHPGDIASGPRGDRFETLLGSCVAVLLTDPRRTFGAICHIVHASPSPASAPPDTRHADAAMQAMQDRVTAAGLHLSQCEAFVSGGGNMFPDVLTMHHVGERNVDWVLDFLRRVGVRVLDTDVGGRTYRRLRWTVGPDAPEITAVAV